jgi:putative spermidine/putrescine transport system ATP-binding protein
MSALTLDRLSKSYDGVAVVQNVSMTIGEGEFVSLLGPSGCGKTTILRMAAGLVEPSQGRVLIGADDVTHLPPNRRGLGLVFQSYALFPHLNVFENVAFGLRRRQVPRAEIERRVERALAMVRLAGFGDRYPRQLSGGQQQRVAIARAIAPEPRVLLFDEPLSNLDAQLRDEMQIELKRLQRSLGVTTLFVTHDQGEALSMSDRVGVMAHGIMQQFGSPEDIYHRPMTAFVASFIGKPNRLRGVVAARRGAGGLIRLGDGVEIAAANVSQSEGAPVEVIIRQEAVRLEPSDVGKTPLRGAVALRSFSGARVRYVIRLADGVELLADTASDGAEAALAPDTRVGVTLDPAAVFVMAPAKGAS